MKKSSPREIQNYLGRISGPLLDRIDLHIEVPQVKFLEISGDRTGETSAQIRERDAFNSAFTVDIMRPVWFTYLSLVGRHYKSYIAIKHERTHFMKKTIRLRWTLWLLSINAAIAVLSSGCATPKEHSFNSDFGENFPAQPMYYIEDENAEHFKITVHQGTPSAGAERVLNIKDAATAIATAESKRLGWEKWQLNYIDERNQGWMHIVIAEVTREKYIAPTFPQPNGNP
jgi:hypothetical protein